MKLMTDETCNKEKPLATGCHAKIRGEKGYRQRRDSHANANQGIGRIRASIEKEALMPLAFDHADLEATRRVNRRLARLPRLRLYHPAHRTVLQALVALGDRVQGPPPPRLGVAAEDRTVSALGRSVRVRLLKTAAPIRGVHIHIHGGGWTIGSARMNDPLNVELALAHRLAVVSVEYRLIPRVPLYAALDDCETAARWVLSAGLAEFGCGTVTIGGESAGAHLAAATILRL